MSDHADVRFVDADHDLKGLLVDVRSASEFAAGHVPGAVNIPVDDLSDVVAALPAGPVVVMCGGLNRGVQGAVILRSLGVDAWVLRGGTAAWAAATGRALEKS